LVLILNISEACTKIRSRRLTAKLSGYAHKIIRTTESLLFWVKTLNDIEQILGSKGPSRPAEIPKILSFRSIRE